MATAKKAAANPADPYCYALLDDGVVFYVGKGRGRRMYQHQVDALRGATGAKCERIREIVEAGREVECRVLSVHANDEQAVEAENKLLREMDGLLNCAGPRKPHTLIGSLRADLRRLHSVAARFIPFQDWVRAARRTPEQIATYWQIAGEFVECERFIQSKLEAAGAC